MLKKYISYFFTAVFFIASIIFILKFKRVEWGLMFGFLQFFIFFFFMLVLSGQWLRSLNFASIIMVSIYFMAKLNHHYYKKPLFMSDFLVFTDISNWDVIFEYKELIFIIFAYLSVLAFAVFAYKNMKKIGFKTKMISIVFFIALLFIHQNLILSQKVKKDWLNTFPSPLGVYMNLSMSIDNMKYSSPYYEEKYSYFKDKKKQIKTYQTSNLKPNLILWLDESTLDTSFYRGDLQQLPMFKETDNTKYNSLIRVHTYGGNTFKSEFEILTGLSPSDFGANSSTVFYNVTSHLKYSLPKILKENGYYTIVLNPFNLGFFNSHAAYKDFGFEEFVHPQDLGYRGGGKVHKNLWQISTGEMAQYAKKVFEKYKDKEPLFVYMLTINEHGPYDRAKNIDFGLERFYERNSALKLTDYYQRQKELNDATIDFDNFMKNTQRPYVFAYFGDHQGDLGFSEKDFKFDFNQPLNITGLYIRGDKSINKIIKTNNLSELSLGSGILLELMQIQPNDFFMANYAMRKLCGNVDDCQDKKLTKSYKSYLYDYLKSASI